MNGRVQNEKWDKCFVSMTERIFKMENIWNKSGAENYMWDWNST